MTAQEDIKKAANEAAFREANERIEAARAALQPPLERVPFICECDDVDCRTLVRLTPVEYESVRSEGTHFFTVPGHSTQGEIVEEHETYVVVRKQGVEAEVASALDPRDGAA